MIRFLPILLLFPAVAWADGEFIGSCKPSGQSARGDYACNEYYLCKDKVAADSACGEMDFGSMGWPDHYVIEIDDEGACSATPEVTPIAKPVTSGTEHDLTTTALTSSGDSAVVLAPPSHRIISANLASMTSCAVGNGLDVKIRLFNRRTQQ